MLEIWETYLEFHGRRISIIVRLPRRFKRTQSYVLDLSEIEQSARSYRDLNIEH